MRNLKRVLSLALALVMVLGMMVITTSAADFTDADEITYTEAVDVMSALGVINGFEAADGTYYFDADATLTREQGAAFVCYLLMGKTAADKLVGSGNFSDVATNRWSAGAIDYCANLGLVKGNPDGTFNPTGPLTSIAFGRMLLGALGYDGNVEGYVGENWASCIAADMIEAGLEVKDVAMDAQLTREQAAQMALQALTATMVKYENKGTSITIGGAVINTAASEAKAIVNDASSYKVSDAAAIAGETFEGTLQFCEKYFPLLKVDTGDNDAFEHPAAYKWTLAGDDVHNVMKTATYTFTAKKPASVSDAATLSAAINDALGITKASKKLVFTAGDNGSVNGADTADADMDIKKDDVVEVYVDPYTTDITDVVITRYTLVKVKNIVALTPSQLKVNSVSVVPAVKNASSYVTLTVANGSTGADISAMYDTKIADFDYAKNDYFLAALNGDNTAVLATKDAATVEGTVSAIKGGNQYNIGGTYYEIASTKIGTVAIADNGVEGKWVLDVNGKLASTIDVSAKSSDYAYVYRITAASGAGTDGYSGTNYTVYAVLADGSKVSYPLALDVTNTYVKGDTSGAIFGAVASNKDNSTVEHVVAYTINAKGAFEVIAGTQGMDKDTGVSVDKTTAVIDQLTVNNETKFVFVDDDTSNKKLTVTTATGYKNVDINSETTFSIYNRATKVASVVFVSAKADALDASANAVLAVLKDATPVKTGTGIATDPYVYTYSIIVGATETTLEQAAPITWGGIEAGDVFYYTLNSAGVASVTEVTNQTVVAVIDETNIQVSTDGAIDLTDVAQYTLTIDTTAKPATTYTVAEGATYGADANYDGYIVVVYKTLTGVKAVYVVNTIVDPTETSAVTSTEALTAAMADASKPVLLTANVSAAKNTLVLGEDGELNGNGNTVAIDADMAQTAGEVEIGIKAANGGTIKNVTIDGGVTGINFSGSEDDVVLNVENVTIVNSHRGINGGSIDGANLVTLNVTNSTLAGQTSYMAGTATFTDCSFVVNSELSKPNKLEPYTTTVLDGCYFEAGFALDATSLNTGYAWIVGGGHTITLKNCYVGNTLVTAENLTTLLGANAAGATVANG